MLTTVTATDVAATIRRHGGGGPRRIAESAGVVVDRGEGAWLIDTDGRRYLDFATAMGVAAIGHAHPIWREAIGRQAARLAATVLHTAEHAEYLERLAGHLPAGIDRIALYSGGAEAVEVAIRLAQSVTGRRHLISFTSGFHGKTLATRFTGGRYPDERAWVGIDWVHHFDYPACLDHDATTYPNCRATGDSALQALEERSGGLDVAAVIVEPVLGTAGNRPPERGFLARLRALCDRRGWLLIADESITGFGRLGHFLASDHFEVRPDIVILGKAMGGGYPLSGVAAPSDLWDQSLFADLSATSSSYGANPVACAAGLAVLDVIGFPGFLDSVAVVGRRLARGLQQIETVSPYLRRARGAGMMLGFDFIDPDTGALAGPELCRRLFRRCLDAGILIVGDVPGVRLNPPLVLTEAEADRAVEALSTAVGH